MLGFGIGTNRHWRCGDYGHHRCGDDNSGCTGNYNCDPTAFVLGVGAVWAG
jgi:hypothetical protein